MPKNDDKTEKPTPKRKGEFRKRGSVAKSPDVSAWLIVLISTFLIPVLYKATEKKLMNLFGQVNNVIVNPTPQGAMIVLEHGLTDLAEVVIPTAGVCALIGIVATVAQTGLLFSLQAAKPKWNKLNPVTGIKNLFSSQSLWQLGKQVIKLSALVGIAYEMDLHLAHSLVGSSPVDMTPMLRYAGSGIMAMVRDVAGVALLLGFGDFFWQRRHLAKQMKMSKQEVKDEAKNADGDPFIKGKIKGKMRSMSRQRMLAAVTHADVVVMNPTHYAVALQYDPAGGRAPVVVAKGADDLALRIKAKALEEKVPVVEDPPLARAVYAACELDEAIPAELFLAVARLLAFVFTLSPLVRSSGIVHHRASSSVAA